MFLLFQKTRYLLQMLESAVFYKPSGFVKSVEATPLVSLKKELHLRYRIVRLIARLAICHKEVFADEKHMATTGGKKPSEHAC